MPPSRTASDRTLSLDTRLTISIFRRDALKEKTYHANPIKRIAFLALWCWSWWNLTYWSHMVSFQRFPPKSINFVDVRMQQQYKIAD
jgi:hypothetical protein